MPSITFTATDRKPATQVGSVALIERYDILESLRELLLKATDPNDTIKYDDYYRALRLFRHPPLDEITIQCSEPELNFVKTRISGVMGDLNATDHEVILAMQGLVRAYCGSSSDRSWEFGLKEVISHTQKGQRFTVAFAP